MKIKNKNSPIIPFLKGDENRKAFTLVELIVVITILAILSTIGFVSYSSYLAGTRDGNRISQLKAISEGLHLYGTNHSLPTPDTTSTSIMDGLTQIATQGYAGKNVLETITYSTEGVDPKDKTYFSYYLTANKKYFQLMAWLEEEDNLQNTAVGVDYSTRYPTVFGDKLGILTTVDNLPLQESTGSIDISGIGTTELKSFLKDGEYVSGNLALIGLEIAKIKDIDSIGGKFWKVLDNKFVDYDPEHNYPGCDTLDITVGGITIAACNVGTNTAATEYNDEGGYGDYFQFGKVDNSWVDGNSSYDDDWKAPGGIDAGSANDWGVLESNKITATYVNSTVENQLKMQGPCEEGYHVPTNKEWSNLISISGITNSNSVYSILKIPSAGMRWLSGGSFIHQGVQGYYGSSSPDTINKFYYHFYLVSQVTYNVRYFAYPIRCFKN